MAGLIGQFHSGNRLHARTADDVYDHVVTAIIDQRLPPGSKLAEEALSDAFGLGRRAIGTALDRLVWAGLVTRPRNRGAFVAAPSAADAKEIFEARHAIEAGVVEAVCRAPTLAAVHALTRNVDEEAACRASGRLRQAVRLSGGFHVILAEQAGNRILYGQVRLLVARTSLVVSLHDNPDGLTCWHDEHRHLIALIGRRQSGPAVALMHAHLLSLENSLDLGQPPEALFDVRDIFRVDRT